MDWTTISARATAGGTLVLAVATFASVRSANTVGRVAEQALPVSLRPLLLPSGTEDHVQKVRFAAGRYVHVKGGRAIAEVDGDAAFLAMSLRNAGTGIGVIHGWRFLASIHADGPAPDPMTFRSQSRDMYVSPGVVAIWQGAIRDANDPEHDALHDAVGSGGLIGIDLHYGGRDAGQRSISRFVLERPGGTADCLNSVVRHWSIDGPRIE